MRMLFLNRSFWPDYEGAGQHLTGLCIELARRHEVTVIAGPSLHVTTSSHGMWAREKIGNVNIIRTAGTRFSKSRLAGRLLNLGTHYVLAAAAALRVEAPDVLIPNTDPPLLGSLAVALKRRWGCSLVYNVRDLYPDVAQVNGGLKNRALLKLLEVSNRAAYSASEQVLTLGDDMARRIIAKGVPREKLAVVPNWVDCRESRSPAHNELRESFGDKFVVMYAGNIGLSQGLDLVVDAAQRLRNDDRLLFALVGNGASKPALQRRVQALGLTNVVFLPYQSQEKLSETLGAADLHLITLAPGLAGCLVPSKVYAILAAGRPFIAMMDKDTDVAQMALERSVGYWVPAGDTEGLIQTLRAAVSNPNARRMMGERARRLAEEQFDLPIIAARFESAILSAVTARTAVESAY